MRGIAVEPRAMKRLMAALLSASLACALAPDAAAWAQPAEAAGRTRSIFVPANKSSAFHLNGPVGEVVVAQPEMAQIVAMTDHSFYVRGKAMGSTNILVYDRGRRLMEVIDVHVGQDTAQLETDLAASLPSGSKVTVRPVGKGVLMSGDVPHAAAAARARAIAERYVPAADITTAFNVIGAEQVELQVRVLEASRTTLKELGIDLTVANLSGFVFASGSGLLGAVPAQGGARVVTNSGTTTIDLTIRALEEKGVLRTLARPNLTALSGEAATFLAGGEFPVPVAADYDDNNRTRVGIEFKPFGVRLDFTPTVADGGLVRLKVAPEVSQLDPRQGVRLAGVDIPGLSVRRASTTVELREGEHFAIAGLFQQEYGNAIRQLPFLGDIPVLGALFRSARWRRQETELVIIVTPRLVQPTRDLASLPQPLAPATEAGDAALMLGGKALDRPMRRPVGAPPTR